MKQEQFLDVIDRDEAQRRFQAVLALAPLEVEEVALADALDRVLGADVIARVDVPSFDRSNFDGFAVRAADTYGAREEDPRRLQLEAETIATGIVPRCEVRPGRAVTIATGAMMPRGADAVVMVEDTDLVSGELLVTRAVTPGQGVSGAGSDLMAGETVLRRGQLLTSRDTGVLAAIGVDRVSVRRRPRVAILSTGNEIIPPGQLMRPGLVYDSNARILADAVRELGGEPVQMGIAGDEPAELRSRLAAALDDADVVLLSGGTSKGAGDVSYHVVRDLASPGIVAHGVALKPGKPICLAAHDGKAVVILPGFPTSAIFTFHEFVAPVIRRLAGRRAEDRQTIDAKMAVRVNSVAGRAEFLLVGLVSGPDGLAAYPMGGGSGSVTTFSRADGFVTLDRHEEFVEAGAPVRVELLASRLRLADLVVIGSHCPGLDYLLGRLEDLGFACKFMAVGSTAGLEAVRRGECDLAGAHLLDPASGRYNAPFLTPDLELIEGYGRLQGVIYRRGDARFEGLDAREAILRAKEAPDCIMVNRNAGSGTRILIDRLLAGSRPPGYAVQSRSHNAVAAAVAQGRADWGVAVESAASRLDLGFLPLEHERYDFFASVRRAGRPGLKAFRSLLSDPEIRGDLRRMGLDLT